MQPCPLVRSIPGDANDGAALAPWPVPFHSRVVLLVI
jgi:hypothetical protein